MESLKGEFEVGWDLSTAVREAVKILGSPDARELASETIEAGVLDRTRPQRRKFRRLADDEIAGILSAA
jgi:proteasome alpha subunit